MAGPQAQAGSLCTTSSPFPLLGGPGVAVDCPQTGEEENTKAGTRLLVLCRSLPLENLLPLLLCFPHLVGRVGGR